MESITSEIDWEIQKCQLKAKLKFIRNSRDLLKDPVLAFSDTIKFLQISQPAYLAQQEVTVGEKFFVDGFTQTESGKISPLIQPALTKLLWGRPILNPDPEPEAFLLPPKFELKELIQQLEERLYLVPSDNGSPGSEIEFQRVRDKVQLQPLPVAETFDTIPFVPAKNSDPTGRRRRK